jgi:hypothetical protein
VTAHGSLLTVLAAIGVWYVTQSLAVRNQDSLWIGWVMGLLTIAAGVTWQLNV